jgi:hypothetical protein
VWLLRFRQFVFVNIDPCHLQICRLNIQNLTAVIGILTAEVRYLFSKNRLSCRFNSRPFFSQFKRSFAIIWGRYTVQKYFEKLLKLSICTDYCDCAHSLAVLWPAFDRISVQNITNCLQNQTRLKRLPVISREHFRKTLTIYFYIHLLGISNTNLQNGISNTSALKRQLVFQRPIGTLGADWYFECQLVLRVRIVSSNADSYFKCQLLLWMPIVTSNTNRVTIHQLVLRIPIGTSNTKIGTSNTNCYFKYQLLL